MKQPCSVGSGQQVFQVSSSSSTRFNIACKTLSLKMARTRKTAGDQDNRWNGRRIGTPFQDGGVTFKMAFKSPANTYPGVRMSNQRQDLVKLESWRENPCGIKKHPLPARRQRVKHDHGLQYQDHSEASLEKERTKNSKKTHREKKKLHSRIRTNHTHNLIKILLAHRRLPSSSTSPRRASSHSTHARRWLWWHSHSSSTGPNTRAPRSRAGHPSGARHRELDTMVFLYSCV